MSDYYIGYMLGAVSVLIVQFLAPKVFGLYLGSIPIDPDLYHKYKTLTSGEMTPQNHAKLWSEIAKDYPDTTKGRWTFDKKNLVLWRRR